MAVYLTFCPSSVVCSFRQSTSKSWLETYEVYMTKHCDKAGRSGAKLRRQAQDRTAGGWTAHLLLVLRETHEQRYSANGKVRRHPQPPGKSRHPQPPDEEKCNFIYNTRQLSSISNTRANGTTDATQ